jgi:hypothetical protein
MVLGKFLKVNEFSFVINTHSDLPAGMADERKEYNSTG